MKTRKPRVSIGLPVYNGERFLAETMDSLLAQTYTDFDLIISDNASTDSTKEICRAYAARDHRIRYFRNEENVGVHRNFNRVFQLASGEYFKWASADDVCGRELIARCLDVLEGNPSAVLAYPKATYIDGTGALLDLKDPGWDLRSDDPLERMRYVIYSGHWINVVYGLIRARSLASTRLLPIYSGGDYRLLGELSLIGKFFEVPGNLFLRRIHAGESSKNTSLNWRANFFGEGHASIDLPLWHLCFDHLVTVFNSQLRLNQKLSLIAPLLDHMYSAKRDLLMELQEASKHRIRECFLSKTDL